MDKHKLAFETAMTQAASVAKNTMTPDQYAQFQEHFSDAWAACDRAIDEAVHEVVTRNKPTDKRWSLSVTLGLRKEG